MKDTRTVLLENAAKLFVKNGYEKTTTRMIAKAAGIKGPAIYYYFKSKKEILTQIDEDGWRKFQETVFNHVKSLADPEERIRVYIKNMISYKSSQGGKYLMIGSTEVGRACKNRKHYDRQVFDFFRGTLEELSKRRNLGERLNPAFAAFSLFSIVTTLYKWYNPRGRVEIEELADQATTLFLHGFLGEGRSLIEKTRGIPLGKDNGVM